MIERDAQRAKVDRKVKALQDRKFYGKLTLDIQGGNVLRMITEESEKLEDDGGSRKRTRRAQE